MKFEIINPSDKAFVEGDDFETICLSITLLSRGQYGLREVDGDKHMPVLMFCPNWWSNEFHRTIEEAMKNVSKKEMAKVLRTVELAGRRSSLTNFVRISKNLAKYLEASANA